MRSFPDILANNGGRLALLFSIYEIHDHLNKDVHLVHPAFGNHQGQCDEGAVGDSFGAIRTVEDAVVLKAVVACLELIR